MGEYEQTDQNDTVRDFVEFLGRNGLSNTTQRRKIAQALFGFPGHHTLDEFYHHVCGLDPTIGQTTVYRTLKLLCAAGLASEIQFNDNVSRYEVAKPRSHHDHLICLKCGQVVEVYDPDIESLQALIAERNGFTLQGHSHNLYGVCAACQAKK